MQKVWIFFFTLLLMFGCTSKSEKEFIALYDKHKKDSKTLQKTEKIQLYDLDNITKVLFTATYSSKIDKNSKEKKDELFVIGLYLEDNTTGSIDIDDFSLTLNGKPPKKIAHLEEDSKLLKNIPFVFSWTQFYLVHFEHCNTKNMYLKINHEMYGKGIANFSKVAKYIQHKKVFE